MMIYELLTNGDSVGFFPTEADARHHAEYMPQGRYAVREWIDDGDFLLHSPNTCRIIEFTNMNIPATYLSKMRPIAERIAKGALMAGPDERGFDFRHDDFVVFVQIGPIGSDDNKARRRVRITDVWHITGSRAYPADRDVLQMLADERL